MRLYPYLEIFSPILIIDSNVKVRYVGLCVLTSRHSSLFATYRLVRHGRREFNLIFFFLIINVFRKASWSTLVHFTIAGSCSLADVLPDMNVACSD